MTPPRRHNAQQAGDIVGKSASWMYQSGAAGLIPRTKIGHHVWWTDEQCTQIIRDGAQQPKPREQKTAERKQNPAPAKTTKQRKRETAPPATVSNIPVADRSVSRLYRQEASA